jgi:MerR family transcriptional regulator, light-induced transcriptional regulator
MNKFSIKDLENLTGIKAHTIRIWELRYGILNPERTPTNIRVYNSDDLKTVLRIALLNNHGYKISRIHKMSKDEINDLLQKVTDANFKLSLVVNDLIEATLSMNIDAFEAILNMYIRRNGIEHTMEYLILALLEKIGLMWMANCIYPAQEHLISHVIYRKLSLAIEELHSRNRNNSPTVLLFLPEGEIHDLALMYVNYLLTKYHKKTIYLGPNSPLSALKLVYERHRPQYMYMHLTATAEEFSGRRYMQKLSSQFPGCKILVSGSMLHSKKYTPENNMKFLLSLHDVRNELISL